MCRNNNYLVLHFTQHWLLGEGLTAPVNLLSWAAMSSASEWEAGAQTSKSLRVQEAVWGTSDIRWSGRRRTCQRDDGVHLSSEFSCRRRPGRRWSRLKDPECHDIIALPHKQREVWLNENNTFITCLTSYLHKWLLVMLSSTVEMDPYMNIVTV